MPCNGIWKKIDPFDQAEFIRAPDKKIGDDDWIGLDQVYKFAHLDEAWTDLSQRLGCRKLKIRDNPSRMAHRTFTDKMKKTVLDRYHHVFQILGFDEDTGQEL